MSIEPVLSQYSILQRPWRIEGLGGAGGFSGAMLWRLHCAGATYCLRRWPSEHPDRDRLRLIHSVLLHVAAQGLQFIPAPVASRYGATFVDHDGHLWELSAWLPGEANYRRDPSAAKLSAAMTALARFHRAAESFPVMPRELTVSPGLVDRHRTLGELIGGGAARIAGAMHESVAGRDIEQAGRHFLKLFWQAAEQIERELATSREWQIPLQPCIRDVWHDHVLFRGNDVSGIIDFGAMRIETVAGDVARLLGSVAIDDANAWRQGLQAYESLRPLSQTERRFVRVFDRSGTLLSGMNWLRWIYLEQRQFESLPTIVDRLNELCQRATTIISGSVMV